MAINSQLHMHPWTFRRVMWATLVPIFVAISYWLLYLFSQIHFILFVAILMGTGIKPVVPWLNRRYIPRMAGIFLVSRLLLFPLIGGAL